MSLYHEVNNLNIMIIFYKIVDISIFNEFKFSMFTFNIIKDLMNINEAGFSCCF